MMSTSPCVLDRLAIVLVAVLATVSQLNGKLIRSPPKLETESPAVVWFHIPSTGSPPKFSLKCNASGDPEKYTWYRNGVLFPIDEKRVVWQRPGQSGTITFLHPEENDQGFYQCNVSNIYGVAMSNIFEVKVGVLDHFSSRPIKTVPAYEGEPLTLNCSKPLGIPDPTIFWLYRDVKKSYAMDTVNRKHITVDGDGNLQFSYVEKDDGTENRVYQCAATSPVLHGEYRAGDEFQLEVAPKRTPSTPIRKMWTSPESIRVAAGQNLRLSCIFSGRPLPLIQWSKEGASLPTDRIEHEDYGKTIVIKSMHLSDQGRYTCDAEGKLKHTVTVDVTSTPQWIRGPPNDLNLREEEDAELRCQASGDPPPLVKWFMNGRPINDFSHPRLQILQMGEVLRITKLNHDIDTAVYQCNVSNPLGYVFANAYINVFAHEPRFTSPIDQTIKATIGSTVYLDCDVEAAPVASVKWIDSKDRDVDVVNTRFELMSNDTLKISELNLMDSGLFFCLVNNKYGINRAKRKLEVYKPTYFTIVLPKENLLIDAGTMVPLRCEAERDTRLHIQYSWYKDSMSLKDGFLKDISYKFIEPNELHIDRVAGRHSGVYKCVARTEVDAVETSMVLTVKDVPDSPRILDINCDERRALVKWAPAFDNYEPVEKYLVEYQTEFHPNIWTVAVTEKKANQEQFEAIVNLSPWVNYAFRVIAVNRKGAGVPGYKVAKCNTPPSYPYTNPQNVTAAGDQPDNLVIYWQPMDKMDWNGERFRYLVRYRLDEPSSRWEEFEVEDPLQGSVTVRDQPTFRKYLVQVVALNSIGRSLSEPHTAIGYSGEDAPLKAPQQLKIVEIVNSTTVRLQWEHVDTGTIRGHFKGYKIQSWLILTGYQQVTERLKDVLVPANENLATVNLYEPMNTYEAVVVAYNTKFDGPPGEVVYFTMPEGIPGPVMNLVVKPLGSTVILTQWEAPSEPRGRLRGYYLSFASLESGGENTEEETWVPYPRSSHLFESAKADTSYVVSVWAETGGGEGARTSLVIKTWGYENPGKPGMKLNLLSSSEVEVTWLPSEDGLPGTAFMVNYSLIGSNVWHSSDVMTVPENQVVVKQLKPNLDYTVVLIAKDGDRYTESDPQFFRTVNITILGQVVTIEKSLTGIAWFIAVASAGAVAVVVLFVLYVFYRNRGGKYSVLIWTFAAALNLVKKKEIERGTNLNRDEERCFMEYQYGCGSSDLTT